MGNGVRQSKQRSNKYHSPNADVGTQVIYIHLFFHGSTHHLAILTNGPPKVKASWRDRS